MRIVIEADVFAGQHSEAEHRALLEILWLGMDDGHAVSVEPERGPAFRAWLDACDQRTRKACEKALAAGLKQHARRRRRDLRVARIAEPAWAARRLPLVIAHQLVKRPLVLLLENARNDGEFLRVLTRLRRDFDLDRLVARGLVVIDGNGGVDENRKWLEKQGDDPALALRCWVMCDSDARRGWERSADGSLPADVGDGARKMEARCRLRGIPIHVLSRRFLESYLPLPALRIWSARREEWTRRYEALANKLTPEQRHFYNMKKGFAQDEKDASHAARVGDWYATVDAPTLQHLREGLHPEVGKLFHEEEFRIREKWLEADGLAVEASAIVDAIMELV